jgi:hypothetical protein
MIDGLKELFKQPYWVIALIAGVVLVALPTVTIDKDNHWATHAPNTFWLAGVGVGLLLLSAVAFGFTVWTSQLPDKNTAKGLDLSRVKESNGVMSTIVSGCEVRIVEGRVENHPLDPGTTVVLPCNEYFDDKCAGDIKSALGAYVNRVFEGQVDPFISLVKSECRKKLGPGVMRQKTGEESAESFGAGRCILLLAPLGRSSSVALVSTTTQRAGQGLAARISYLFDGMRELSAVLADARINDVVMPILGAGHGRIDTALAFVGLLLAIAEAARYGQGGQRLTRVTVVVFKRDADTPAQVDRVIVKRALALIATQN